MIEDDILRQLQAAVGQAVAACPLPELPIKYFGRVIKIPDDQRWLELVIIPNSANDFWGNEQQHKGMFRLILHWPTDDAGAYAPLAVIRSIAGYFSKSLVMTNVKIVARPALTGVLEQGTETLYPVTMRYLSYEG